MNARIRAIGAWLYNTVVGDSEFEAIDAALARSVDGGGGGAYAPTSAIEIGGEGIECSVTPVDANDLTPKFFVDQGDFGQVRNIGLISGAPELSGAFLTLNVDTYQVTTMTLDSNPTILFGTAPTQSRSFLLVMTQDGSGGRIPVFGSPVAFEGGTCRIDTDPGQTSVFFFFYTGVGYYGISLPGQGLNGMTPMRGKGMPCARFNIPAQSAVPTATAIALGTISKSTPGFSIAGTELTVPETGIYKVHLVARMLRSDSSSGFLQLNVVHEGSGQGGVAGYFDTSDGNNFFSGFAIVQVSSTANKVTLVTSVAGAPGITFISDTLSQVFVEKVADL